MHVHAVAAYLHETAVPGFSTSGRHQRSGLKVGETTIQTGENQHFSAGAILTGPGSRGGRPVGQQSEGGGVEQNRTAITVCGGVCGYATGLNESPRGAHHSNTAVRHLFKAVRP